MDGQALQETNEAQPALFAVPDIQAHHRPDGSIVLRSKRSLGDLPRALGAWLEHWGTTAPERPFLAERDATGGWRRLSYGEALDQARAVGQSLLDRRLDPANPILILAENGIDHAVMTLAALHAGLPVAPVSTAYARLSQDFQKLRHIAHRLAPRLVYADDAERYGKAIAALGLPTAEIVASRGTLPGRTVTPFASLRATRPGPEIEEAFAQVGPDTVAKILFTSGSTGSPKGVINTQRMLVANQESIAAAWPFLARTSVTLVDWLPWNHTYGANHNFNLVLRNGGVLFIDEGRPLPGLIERTIANLKDVSPTIYFGVPRGFAVLLDHLERDPALQTSFFDQLALIMYAGASLPDALWQRIGALSERVLGRRVAMTSGWGLTETAPVVTMAHYEVDRPGNIGVPVPGSAVKLVPVGDRLEIRCKGLNVTPGYFKEPGATRAAFDEEGWLRTGDASRFAVPIDAGRGLVFDGRIAENFKLATGTWVSVGALRVAAISAAAPLIEDCVVAGHDRDEIGLLVFLSVAGARAAAGEDAAGLGPDELARHPAVRSGLARGLARHNALAGGSSGRIARALILAEPPSIDAGEITDKGYINQRAVLERRTGLLERLYATPPADDVILARAAP